MNKLIRARRLAPVALVTASAAIALAASPASAATINISVGSNQIPSGASCVYVTGTRDGGSSDAVKFTAGGTANISGISIGAGEIVDFDWRGANCSGGTIRDDRHTAPNPLPTVWDIN